MMLLISLTFIFNVLADGLTNGELTLDALSQTFSALADPTRRAILQQLSKGGASFTELARPHEISRPAVVKHIKALERAGLVQRTGSETRPVYQLSAGAMHRAATMRP